MNEEWAKKSYRLKDRHGWKARPGYAICAIDRGAIRFDYPEGWHVRADSDSLSIRDHPSPDDNCILAVSRMRLPPIADQVALRELILASTNDEKREVVKREDVVNVPREDGVELCCTEIRHVDRTEKREAFSRIAIARGGGVYCLMTFDFWVDDLAKYGPVWEEAIRSLTLGMYIQDPTVGPVVH